MNWHRFPDIMPEKNGTYYCTLSEKVVLEVNDEYVEPDRRWINKFIWDANRKTFYDSDGTVFYPRPYGMPEIVAWADDPKPFIDDGILVNKNDIHGKTRDDVEYVIKED